ncbi:MAG: polysaccharide deacetylase family protein [Chloroflexi bacterium]|nr:MAG: polysaccharide deacetylase family protein [Chloroflexota bacterium]
MGHVAGRVAVAAALLLATSYLLQADDSRPFSAAPLPVAAVQLAPILTVQAGNGDREYFVSHREVVPLGSPAISLPILMYHYVRKPPSIRTDMIGFKLSVSPEDFQAQMDWLYAHHYHPVNFNQARAYFAGSTALPTRPIVITLDDGYQDLYTAAFPILKAHGFTAVAYIVSGFVDRPGYVSRRQLLEMDRTGIEIASHTVNHPDLARSGLGSMTFEVVQSKRWLEETVGHPVLDFAYPSGKYNAQAIQAVSRAGYSTAVTTSVSSTMHSMADRYAWGRVRVGGGESLQEFITNLGPNMPSTTISTLDVEQS